MKFIFALLAMAGYVAHTSAQVNQAGTIQFALGAAFGVHATHYRSEVNAGSFSVKYSDRDAAVTTTYPLEVHYGLSDRLSLGLCVEPGRYLDSAGTQPNSLVLFAVSPRFHAINYDRFTLLFEIDLGVNTLRIAEVRSGNRLFEDRYSGGFLRPGATVQWYLGETIGLGVGLSYAAHSLNWTSRDPEDPALDRVNYSASLRTSGAVLQVGLLVKL